jgi:uncharacterized protein (TIGR03435 family)
MQTRSLMLALLFALVVVHPLRAQAPASNGKSPSFEVASIKRNTSGSLIANHAIEGSRYTGTNLSVKDLLVAVYAPLPRARLVGGPDWINSDRFDIVAIADDTPGQPEVMQMVRSLLMERFRLAVHSEVRDGDVYDLIVARSAAELGPMLKAPSPDCAVAIADWRQCPRSIYPGKLMGTGVTMADLARMLEPFTEQRTVRDRTGLTGRYDVQLTWTPDRLGPLPPNAPEEVVRAREAIDPNGPALSTALREQLGLRLETKKDKVDVLVIDRVERPTEN